MKSIFSFVLICLFLNVSAKTYYFSTLSGDDSRSATQAQSQSTPWKSISKLNSIFSTLVAGDSVVFKRGETFYGTITINKSGTSTDPIVISAYGLGSKPVMTTLITLSGWTASSTYSGVYESAANTSFGSSSNILLINDVQYRMGRFPNSNAPEKGYLTVDSHSGSSSITDKDLPSSPNWTGAELVIRPNRWMMDRSTITSHSGSTIVYSNSTSTTPKDGFGYFIQNSINTLDQFGEWYYNPSTKKMSVYFGSNNPSGYTVKASTKDNFVYSSGISNVTIDNLVFQGCNLDGININSGTNMVVQNADIMYSGEDGVTASGTNFRLENCTVTNSYNNGVHVARGKSAVVRNNIIRNSYSVAGMGQSGNGQGAGIRNSVSGLVEYNQVINSGYVGIQIGGDNSIIRYNLIDSFGFVKDDGGGLYTSNGSNVTLVGRKVIGNIVLNGIGAKEGANSTNSSAHGIYLDDNTNGVEVTDNTIASCDKSIYLHNSRSIVVKNNTFYNSVSGQLYMKYDGLGDPLRNHTITNNIFFSKEIDQLASSVSSIADDLASAGKLDSNYYARPIDDATTIFSSYSNSSGQTVSSLHDLNGWKNTFKFDLASKTSAKQIAPYTISGTTGTNKTAFGSFSSSSDIQKIWANNSTLSWISSGGLDGGTVKVVPTSTGSSIVMTVGPLSKSKKYILSYSVKGVGNLTMGAYLRAGTYEPITSSKYWPVTTSRDENEMLFTPEKDDSNGSIVFNIDAKQTYYIDNVKIFEAIATPTNPDDSIRFVYNPSKNNKTIGLSGNYVDVKNNKYVGSITLKPYASAILIKDGASTNAAPTVSITAPAANKSFAELTSIAITADASDTDGSISKVEFYNGNTILGSDNSSPYSFTWNNVAAGKYSLTAKATDNSGNVTSSAGVNITVVANVDPTVSITSPALNAGYTSPATITLSADASDSDGSISKVEFYNGTALLGSDNTSPYSFTWSGVAAGKYTVTAKATDNSNGTTISSAVSFTVASPNTSPVVVLTNPSTNATFTSGSTISIEADASDADGSITKVDFYSGNTLIGSDNSSPYAVAWSNAGSGKYTIIAKATDNSGAATTSSSVVISISSPNAPPSVNLTSPLNNTDFASATTISIKADASDTDGSISKVEFYNGNTLLGSDNSSPYTFSWSNVGAGKYSITAIATDNNGGTTTSASVNISVSSPNIAPDVSLTSPTAKSNYVSPATVSITADAQDADGTITKVEFYSGNTLLATEFAAPYSFGWNGVNSGSYIITAKAIDNSGAVTTSAPVAITVASPNVAPIVSITSPAGNSTFASPNNIIIDVDATDKDGVISKVEFYSNNILLATDNTSPYSFTWSAVASGSYNITAKATDNDGAITTSSPVAIVVTAANVAPAVTLTSPLATSSIIAPASITISADAGDSDGTITKVEFYNGNSLLVTERYAPYSWDWSDVPAGTYTITAKAFDNSGKSTLSAPVTVTVAAPNNSPIVILTSPTLNAAYKGPASILLSADASDSDGTIAKVEFYNGSTLITTENYFPYSWKWSNVPEGTYTITAKAIDDSGNVTLSAPAVVRVSAPNVLPSVTITSPVLGDIYNTPASVILSVDASDADGKINKVEFYNGSTLITTEKYAPYYWVWNDVPAGIYSITAKAIDNSGGITISAPVTIKVQSPNAKPAVQLTSPVANNSYNGPASIVLSANASDSDGSISKVEFYDGNTLITTEKYAPYYWTWKDVPAGTYNIVAKAIDNSGDTTATSPVTVVVSSSNAAPVITLNNPVSSIVFTSPATISLNATASDPDGTVTKVEFFSGVDLLSSDNASPYTFAWSNVSAGTYSITAVATDNYGAKTTSTPIVVTVTSVNNAPTVKLMSPASNSAYTSPSTVVITADARDADGSISKVEFYNGNILLGSDNTSPYSYSWTNVTEGNYTITAKAIDNLNEISKSSAVNITVTLPNVPPTVMLTSPVSNSSYVAPALVIINADASDNDGSVSKVEFYNGNTLLGSDLTSPYSFVWNDVAAGSYTITAVATDDAGTKSTSSQINISVTPAPFNFKSFSGTAANGTVKLVWETNNTGNTSEFKIQRGKRSYSFQDIGKTPYTHSNATDLGYSFVDSTPQTGKNYYRVVRVDSSGQVISSLVIMVDYSKTLLNLMRTVSSGNVLTTVDELSDGPAVKVGPNPTSSTLSVFTQTLPADLKMTISIISMQGVIAKTIFTNTSVRVTNIDVSTLKKGVYIARIVSGDKTFTRKFIKL